MGEKHREYEYYYTVNTSECCNPFAGKPLFTRTDNPLDLGNVIKRNSEKIKLLQKMFDNGYLQCPTDIKNVIFNGPATIVIWLDGSKTVVKCAEGDGYSKFSGLAIAICKHIYGSNFKKVFNYFIPKEETECHSSETTNSKQ